MSPVTKVLLIDPDVDRRDRVSAAIAGGNDVKVLIIPDTLALHAHVQSFEPDIVVVAAETPARDAIEDLRTIGSPNSGQLGRPVVLFVDRAAPQQAADAMRAGVAAYVVEGLDPMRIRTILDLAMAQFQVMNELRRDLEKAKSELADRKVIDKAKGMIMARRNVTEAQAYQLLRKTAMDQGRQMVIIARELIQAAALLGDGN